MRILFFQSILTISLLVVSIVQTQASHLYGGSIYASCQDACSYDVYIETFWDCTPLSSIQPVQIPNVPTLQFQGAGSCTTPPTPLNAWSTANVIEATPICPTGSTSCTNSNSTIYGVMQVLHKRTYNFCVAGACPSYTASWSNCCRSSAITSGAAVNGVYLNTEIDLSITPCNHAPVFTQPSFVYICTSDSSQISQSAFDADGDSLVYSLVACQNTSSTNVNYNPAYSPLSPLGPSWQVSIDSQTGMVDFIPNTATPQVGVICILVEEYRNGQRIGAVRRDMQISAITCMGSNASPAVDSIQLMSGGHVIGVDSFAMALGDSLTINFWVQDANTSDSLSVYLPLGISDMRASMNGANPSLASITFKPTQTGNFPVPVQFRDNFCPLVGQSTYLIHVRVGAPGIPPVQDSILSPAIHAKIWSDGTLFWDADSSQGLLVPRDSAINMAQAAGLWMRGMDNTGNRLVSAHSQDKIDRGVSDFWTGPLTNGTATTDSTTVSNFNRIWQIDQAEIDAFLLDFGDNGVVDFPQNYPNVYDWPAFGQDASGTNVTATTPDGKTIYLAPFVDVNGNTTDYNPNQGDYPAIKGDRMYWWIYNDQSPTHDPNVSGLGVEIHVSAFVFDCPDSLDKNNSIFFDYTLVNRSNAQINNSYIGFWTDVDAGNPVDDYIAVDTIRGMYYTYNADSWDEDHFGDNPPALGVGVLKGAYADPFDGIDNDKDGVVDEAGESWSMNGFITFDKGNNGVSGQPTQAIHYDRYLRAFWQDGQAVVDNYSNGGRGNGIPSSGSGDRTHYLLSGNVCANTGWTEKNSGNIPGDRQGLGMMGPFTLQPGTVQQFSMHYSWDRGFFLDEIGSVCNLLTKHRELQQFYQSGYQSCGYYDPPVHPGDANFDQVANNLDLLAIGLNYQQTGPGRINPTNMWMPQNALPWGDTLANGADLKHSDCDGTGTIDTFDIAPILLNYGSTHTYTKNAGSGAPLYLLSPTTTFNAGDTARIPIHWGDMNDPLVDAYGIAFSIDYDSSKVVEAWVEYSSSWFATPGSDLVALHKDLREAEKIDIGISRNNQVNRAGYGYIADLIIVMDDDLHKRIEPMTLGISGIYAINKDEEEIPVTGIDGVINLATAITPSLAKRVSLFPNPTQDKLNIQGLNSAEIQQINLYDSRGKKHEIHIYEQQRQLSFSLDHLPAGFYFLEIQTESGQAAFKVIKQP